MARRPNATTQPGDSPADEPTKPRAMPEGHGPKLSRESAQAIADASKAAGHPVPPQAARVLAQAEDQGPQAPVPAAPAGDANPKTEA